MKLNSFGVTISILILIMMMLICHTMNYLYPKNKFDNIPQTTNGTETTNYNEIYYSNQNNKLCDVILTSTQADIPCNVIKSCAQSSTQTQKPTKPKPKISLDNLSNSEIVVLYKVAYDEAAREIFMRTIKELSPTTTSPMTTDYDPSITQQSIPSFTTIPT
jgi:hypothetical protein